MRHLKAALMAWVLSVGGALAAPQGFALHDTSQSVANVGYKDNSAASSPWPLSMTVM